MTVFSSSAQATAVFADMFKILLADEHFASRIAAGRLDLHVVQTKPDVELYIEPGGVHVGVTPPKPVISLRMSCDTAHALWSGSLLLPLALATGKLRIRGPVSKVLEFVPLLQPAFDRYPDLAAEAGLPG